MRFKLPYGERCGDLVHVSDVERGKACACTCPTCGAPLVAKKGAKTRHHFAHSRENNCKPETVLHDLGKRLFFERITTAISKRTPIPLTWECEICYGQHVGDLVKRASSGKLEHSFGTCQPDISLFDDSGKPVATVEIVVTHEPESHVREHAEAGEYPIVEIHLKTAEDLERLVHGGKVRATKNSACMNPKCSACGERKEPAELHVVDGECWKCDTPMKLAFLELDGFEFEGPKAFTEDELRLARQGGAILISNYSRTSQIRYLSNTCPKCSCMTGDSYLQGPRHSANEGTKLCTRFICSRCEASKQ